MKKQLIIIPLIIFSIIILTFFYLLTIQRDPSALPSNLLEKNVPSFKTESLLKDYMFDSSKEFGNEVVLVNFFATWCKPCVDEHAYIKRFAEEKKIRVIGINYKDNNKRTIQWLKDLGNPYSSVPLDKNGKIAIDWGVYGIPETFVVNSNGVIKHRHVGPITKKIYKKINKIIEEID
tara:strand:- start:338 stop:868 length:531 start_codon:yes stop_codon:yes gene_type:complete